MERGDIDTSQLEWRELEIPAEKSKNITIGRIARRIVRRVRKWLGGSKTTREEEEEESRGEDDQAERSEGGYAIPERLDCDYDDLEVDSKDETIQVTITRQSIGSSGPIGVNLPEIRNGAIWWVFMARLPIDEASEDLYVFRSKVGIDPNHFLLKDLILTDHLG